MKVGIFDSGLGGLTILDALKKVTPQYDYLYLGDNKRAPYGPQKFATILEWTLQAVKYLFNQDCQIIILACNTASAKALRTIQQEYLPVHYPERRVLGVIRPSVEYMADISQSKKVAIWATDGTVASQSYELEFKAHAPDLEIFSYACPLLVPHIESGETDASKMKKIIQNYWQSTLELSDKLDTLLLACTHYPILFHQIKEIIPHNIQLVHQGQILGPKWLDYLNRHPEHSQKLSENSSIEYLTTGDGKRFQSIFPKYPHISGPTQSIKLS